MSEDHDEFGLGDYLEFAADDKVLREILGRAEFGICILLKPSGKNKADRFDLKLRAKLPRDLLEEKGHQQSVSYVLDLVKSLLESD
jgi:hypothetical protein